MKSPAVLARFAASAAVASVAPGSSSASSAPTAKVLLPFVTAGYPTLDATAAALPALAAAGGAVIEVGIPFSDPIADGPVIAASMHEALVAGCTPERVFATVKRVRPTVNAALMAMVSFSIVQRMGVDRFVGSAADAGFDGVIVPDIDLLDARALRAACDASGIACTLLVAPTTSPERTRKIVAECTGFVYALSRVGITGERAEAPNAQPVVERIRACTALPVAVGFGISTREHVRAVWQYADGAIVGSSLVKRMQRAVADGTDPVEAAAAFTRELAG
ncbi:MAG: tryptophan synthase subunit alpha [Phycisphaerae bacterium]|nr:tryptophan synthase subunit alpha [Phycisphaerae bacterium]